VLVGHRRVAFLHRSTDYDLLAEKDPSSSRDLSPTDPRRCLVLSVYNIGHDIKEHVAL
jgi:hypothetical protein